MARLRTLAVTTADGPRDILILDRATVEQAQGINTDPEDLKAAGIPPVLAFDYEVDLPETDAEAEDIDITTHADLAKGHRVALARQDEANKWARRLQEELEARDAERNEIAKLKR